MSPAVYTLEELALIDSVRQAMEQGSLKGELTPERKAELQAAAQAGLALKGRAPRFRVGQRVRHTALGWEGTVAVVGAGLGYYVDARGFRWGVPEESLRQVGASPKPIRDGEGEIGYEPAKSGGRG